MAYEDLGWVTKLVEPIKRSGARTFPGIVQGVSVEDELRFSCLVESRKRLLKHKILLSNTCYEFPLPSNRAVKKISELFEIFMIFHHFGGEKIRAWESNYGSNVFHIRNESLYSLTKLNECDRFGCSKEKLNRNFGYSQAIS